MYNTSVGALLNDSINMLAKMKRVFEYFKSIKDDITLIWRPHPLSEVTLRSMRAQLLDEYIEIVKNYKKEDFGIYYDGPDMDKAMILSDAYYGDSSSLITLYKKLGKPVMVQNINV